MVVTVVINDPADVGNLNIAIKQLYRASKGAYINIQGIRLLEQIRRQIFQTVLENIKDLERQKTYTEKENTNDK